MKKLMTLIAFVIATQFTFAQYKINVQEKSENLGGANNNAFSVMIYELSVKDVEKDWKKVMKKWGANVQMKKEMFGDDANTSEMGDNNFDIYAIAKEVDGGVELTVAIDLGGAFLSSGQHGVQAKFIKDELYKFAVDATKEGLAGIIKTEEGKQSDLEKEQKDLEKEKEKLEKSIEDNEKAIEDAKKAIEDAKKEIEKNGKDQEEKKKEIEAQKKVVADFVAKEKAVGLDELHIQLARYARNLKERGDFDGAMEVYQKVAELFPEYPGLLSDLAGEYFFAGQFDKAKEQIRRSLAVPNVDEATLGNGFFLSSLMGDYDVALETIRRLPGNGSLLYEGILKFYRNEKKWNKTIDRFLSENPDTSDAKAAKVLAAKDFEMDMDNYIGIIENDLGDPTKILIHEKFRETNEFLPAFNAAETYCYNQRYDAAVTIFSEIENHNFDLDTDDREQYLFYYAWSLHQNDQRKESVNKWEQLLESEDFYKKSAAHWFVGKYYFDQEDKAKGREYFSKMATDPSASKYATMCWNYMGE